MALLRFLQRLNVPLIRNLHSVNTLRFYPSKTQFCRGQYHDLISSPAYKALFVDAAGTLLYPSQPAASIYRQFALKYGVTLSEDEILERYRDAFAHPPLHNQWASGSLRYVGDGKEFWSHIIYLSTGCDSPKLVDELYHYYEQREAWFVEPDAYEAFLRLKKNGIKILIVSNFDTRLRPLLNTLGFKDIFDDIIVSAEIGAEKPNPTIFYKALELAKCKPIEAVHVGDDRRNDVWGARGVGINAWLWKSDVHSFEELANMVLRQKGLSEDDGLDSSGNSLSASI